MPSTTRPAGDARQRREVVEARILAAVESMLADGASFTELSVQRLAEGAGVARSTFYLYFVDKAAVVVKLSENLARDAFEVMGAWDPSRPKALTEYARALATVVGYYRSRRPALAAVLEMAAYDVTVRESWETQLAVFDDAYRALIRAEQAAGRTSKDIDVVTASRLSVWGGMQTIAWHVLSGDPADDDAFARELAEVQWYGVFRRPVKKRR